MSENKSVHRIALIGSNGMLANMIKRNIPAGTEILSFDLPEFDLTDQDQVLGTLGDIRPEAIINCAAFTNVDGCESQAELAFRVNGKGPGYLAAAARATGAVLVHISTDYVFDGTKSVPYAENDTTNPQSVYGQSKLAGEQAILQSGLAEFFIIRTSWLYGPGGKNFVTTIARLATEKEELRIVADQVGSPTYTEDLAGAVFNLLTLVSTPGRERQLPPFGVYHFANEGYCSWYEFAVAIVAELENRGIPVTAKQLTPIGTDDYPLPASRPKYSVFAKNKYKLATGAAIPDWQGSLKRYISTYW